MLLRPSAPPGIPCLADQRTDRAIDSSNRRGRGPADATVRPAGAARWSRSSSPGSSSRQPRFPITPTRRRKRRTTPGAWSPATPLRSKARFRSGERSIARTTLGTSSSPAAETRAGRRWGPRRATIRFRRLTVLDGDDHYGERCELGWNSHHGPVAFYREGRRRITYASVRLPSTFPLATSDWQNVLQIKQAGPSDNSGGLPVLRLSAYSGRWMLWHSVPGDTPDEDLLWSAPARGGVWTRFAFDITFSRHRSKGRLTVLADLSGDGDFADRGERSRRFRTNTLKVEIAGTASDGYRKGQSLPSHLRAGIYRQQRHPLSGADRVLGRHRQRPGRRPLAVSAPQQAFVEAELIPPAFRRSTDCVLWGLG